MLFELYKRNSVPPFGNPILNKTIVLRNTLDRTPGLKGWSSYEPITGGAMNTNYKVIVDKKTLTLRILSSNPDLKMNRKNELYNLKIASKLKLAPKVVDYNLDNNVIVTEYLEGKTVTNSQLQNKYFTFEVIDKIKELHEGPKFLDDLDPLDKFNEYYAKCINSNYKLPKEFKKNLKHINRISKVLNDIPKLSVPCHGDLWAPNILITDNGEIKFIDFEFSGNADPLYEIGNFWNESGLSFDILQDIIRHYYGHYSNKKTYIAELYSIFINCLWVLWGTIQINTSKINYDFDGFVKERLEKALPKLNKKYLNNLVSNII
jgi:thiamine kinase-like enzyme